MFRRLLILRPAPGAERTAAAAKALGFDAIVAPLFTVRPVAWQPPPSEDHDALLLTSANAVRNAGPGLVHVATLPIYAVGKATAEEARAAGLKVAHVGSSDAAGVLARMREDGITRPLHLAGRDHRDADIAGVTVKRRIVYASEQVAVLPDAATHALDANAVVLLHSPRAAGLFAALLDRPRGQVAVVALSPAVAHAAGLGWNALAIAATPEDGALLAAAARLCDGRRDTAEGQA